MLDWKMVGNSWFGNGFRIERVAAHHWILEEAEADAVTTDTEPIARLPSLAACRHKAEQIHRDRMVAGSRQRLAMVAVAAFSLALLTSHPLAYVAVGIIGSAALLELAMTWVEGRVGGARELIQ